MTSFDAVTEISDGELDFIYIDGSHRRREIMEDIRMYWNKVKVGGLVAGHDYDREEVRNAIRDELVDKVIESAIVENNPVTRDWWTIRTA